MFQRSFSAATLLAIAVALAACGGEADDAALDEIDLEDEVDPQASLTTPKPDPEPYLVCDIPQGWCKCSGADSCEKLRDMCRKAGGDYEPTDSPNGSETGTCTY